MPNDLRKAAVLGSGTMGAGIAQVLALSGIPVTLHDVDAGALERGRERALSLIQDGVRKGKVAPEAAERAGRLLVVSVDLDAAAAGADLVIEAVPERIELKREIFGRLGARCPGTTILASNTSSLSIARIASGVPAPRRVVGLHFFNPPHVMKLVEIVRTPETSDEVVETVRALAARLGKEAIEVRDSPGFATSRLGLALGLEAMRMVEQGVAAAADIDRAMELGYGHPMGPLKVSDLVGLDVRLGIAEILHRELGGERFAPPDILRRLVSEGKLGKKTGEGFYRWDGSTPRG